jgi:hypothetical protein
MLLAGSGTAEDAARDLSEFARENDRWRPVADAASEAARS